MSLKNSKSNYSAIHWAGFWIAVIIGLAAIARSEPRQIILTVDEAKDLLHAATNYRIIMTTEPRAYISNDVCYFGWEGIRESSFKIPSLKKNPFSLTAGFLFSYDFPKGISIPVTARLNIIDNFDLIGRLDFMELIRNYTNMFRVGIEYTF